MLEAENLLMDQINAAGASLTGHLVESRDAGPQPFEYGGRRFTAKQKKEVRHVETPCGCAVVWRRAFQSSLGGVCYYPMDGAAGLMGAATPKFAQMVSRKLVELPAGEVVRDVRENHARKVTVDFVQNLTGLVGALAAVTVPAPLKQCRDPPRAEAIKVISIQSDLHRRGWSLCADEPARGGSQARRSMQGTHAGMAHCHGWGHHLA